VGIKEKLMENEKDMQKIVNVNGKMVERLKDGQ